MAQAPRDQNLVPTLLGTSSADGTTPVVLWADPTTHRLLTQSSGGGAPSDATFVTLSTNATLTNERVLTGTANQVTITDNGAGSTVVLSLPQSIATSSTPTFASMTLTAASSLTLGTASTNTGAIILKNSTNSNNTVLQAGAAGAALTFTLPTTDGNNGEVLTTDGNGVLSWAAAGGSGTVTSVSVVTANGFAGSVANATTTPAITLTLSGTSATTQVLFNEGGSAIGGDAELAWDTATKKLSLGDVDTMTVNGSTVTTRLAAHSFDAATAAAIEMHNHTDTAGRGPTAYYARSRGTAGTPTVVQSGDSLGELNAVGFDGTDYATSAGIVFEVDGTPGNNDMPGRIIFKTSPDGSQTLAEVLRLAADKTATFAGTVVMPTPFTLGATSVTTTGTQLNYLNAATGTTGTTSTNLVFSTSPTLVTPVLGAATATSINGLTITSSTGTLTITNGKTLSVSNTLTLAGTDGTTMTFPNATDTVMGLGAVQTVTAAKTFNSAALVATRPKFVTSIDDTNGNEVFVLTATGSAVNELTVANAATGANPAITASGDDANVGIDVNLKGTGTFNLKGNATQAAELRLYEDTDNGTNYTAFKVGAQAGNITYTLPTADGSASTYLQTNGSGTLSWASAGGTTGSWVSTDFQTTTRYTRATGGGGTNTFDTGGVEADTSATSTSYASVKWALSGSASNAAFNYYAGSSRFECYVTSPWNAPTTAEGFIGVGSIASAGTGLTFTDAHIGFKSVWSSGTVTISGSCADGATESTTTLTSIDWSVAHKLEFEINSGATSVTFYVDGVSKGTVSSNIPTNTTGSGGTVMVAVSNVSTTSRFSLKPSYFSVFHAR